MLGWLDWLTGRLGWAMAHVVGAIDALVPPVPSALGGLCGRVDALSGWVAPVAAWLPLGDVAVAMGIWVSGLVAGVAIKLVRVGASFATLGGGSAG